MVIVSGTQQKIRRITLSNNHHYKYLSDINERFISKLLVVRIEFTANKWSIILSYLKKIVFFVYS